MLSFGGRGPNWNNCKNSSDAERGTEGHEQGPGRVRGPERNWALIFLNLRRTSETRMWVWTMDGPEELTVTGLALALGGRDIEND